MANSFSRKKTAETGLTKKGARGNVFRIRRFKNDHGFQVYSLENTSEGKTIFIPRFIFGRFRACIRTILKNEISKKQPESFEMVASFLNQDYFYFKSSSTDLDNLIIQDIEEREGSSGYITVNRRSMNMLDQLLYDDKLQHPNDVLQEIISYHKLFQFSFVKGSKSITSGLALRKDILQITERYTPSLAQKIFLDDDAKDAKKESVTIPKADRRKSKSKEANLYKPKLGERFNEKDIRIDYEEVFGNRKISFASTAESDDSQTTKTGKKKSVLSSFPFHWSLLKLKPLKRENSISN